MTNTNPSSELLRRIVDAHENFTAAEADLKPYEVEPFRAALARCIEESDALIGRRRERGRICFRPGPPPGGGWV